LPEAVDRGEDRVGLLVGHARAAFGELGVDRLDLRVPLLGMARVEVGFQLLGSDLLLAHPLEQRLDMVVGQPLQPRAGATVEQLFGEVGVLFVGELAPEHPLDLGLRAQDRKHPVLQA
jgi:hypothetical protein